MPVTPPVTLKGWVKLNWLPKAAEAALWYHAEKIGSTVIVTVVVCRLAPAAAVKVKTAEVTDRVVE